MTEKKGGHVNRIAKRARGVLPTGEQEVNESTPFLSAGRNQPDLGRRAQVTKAALYALQNFYAFMLM